MNFDFTPEQRELRLAVAKFAAAQLKLDRSTDERNGCFERTKWQEAAKYGLHGLPMPETYGGLGHDLLTTVAAMEGLGYGCRDNGLIFSINAHIWSVQMPILHFGTDVQRQRYLPKLIGGEWIGAHGLTEETSGSDALNLKTTAVRRGDAYVLNGSKVFITNSPIADVFLIFANENPEAGADGVPAFLVDRGTEGLSAPKGFEKLGLRTSPMGQVFLDDCVIPASQRLGGEGAGFAIFNSSMEYERACILAANIGTLEHQLECCIERANTWRRFGQPIGKFESVSNRISEMKIRLETARLLVYRAAWRKSENQRAALDSAMAKLYMSECLLQSSLDAVQIFGGYGYVTDSGIEHDLRDAVGGTIYSGTSDIQRLIIARHLGL
jgi:alkylation response protein AidB-like acyl-CoA dehydrogenase